MPILVSFPAAKSSVLPSPARWPWNHGVCCATKSRAPLDPELKNEVLQVLEDLKRDGMTLLMVTHEIGFARRAADRVIVLADAKIIEEGPPSQVIDQPKAPRTRLFLSRVLG